MCEEKKFLVNYFLRRVLRIDKFLGTESPLKMMKNAFSFTVKALLVLEIFKVLSWPFGHIEKQLDKKAMVNFKFFYNAHIAQYLKK